MVEADTPAYFASEAARAAGIDVLTLQNWLKRDAFGFTKHDRVGKGAGSRHLFTLRSVLILATTAEIVRNGITPQHAYRIARRSTVGDVGYSRQTYILVPPGGTSSSEALGGDQFTVDSIFAEMLRHQPQHDFRSVLILAP